MKEQNAVPRERAPSPRQEVSAATEGGQGSLLVSALLALVVGVAAGLAGALFRLSLAHADHFRDELLRWARAEPRTGLLLVLGSCAAATATAAWLVRRYSPPASGSG